MSVRVMKRKLYVNEIVGNFELIIIKLNLTGTEVLLA